MTMQTDKIFALRVMRNLVTPTFVLDAEGNVIIWNLACERLTGVKAEQVMGTQEHWRAFYETKRPCLADVFLSGNNDRLSELYENHIIEASSEKFLSAENWAVMPNIGTKKYLAIDAGPVFDDTGQIIAVVETLRDMTELKNARDQLHQLAITDGLTGLWNRRHFDDQFNEAWLFTRRYQQPLSLMMIDIDYFKQFNDHYGHGEGDRTLENVANTIRSALRRPGDKAFRYGGEEFCVLLTDTDSIGAQQVAQTILSNILDLQIPHEKSPYERVSASIGIATVLSSEQKDRQVLMHEADRMLYDAKAKGRSRIDAWSSEDKVHS